MNKNDNLFAWNDAIHELCEMEKTKSDNKMENETKYRNVFKEKNATELKMLYRQFLEFEETCVIPQKSELNIIRDKYKEWFGNNPISMVQYDLLHAIADLWFETQ